MHRIRFLLILSMLWSAGSVDAQEAPREAHMMRLTSDWQIDGDLPRNAMLISLQGLANLEAPRLYFIYPPGWTFTFTEAVYQFYRDRHAIRFTELETAEDALAAFAEHADGYVVWDMAVRTSLIVAFTVAGLERAVVVSEDLIPMVEAHGLEPVEDFRGRFSGWSDHDIYQWAYEAYWERTSKDYVIWMGGVWGPIMEPGIADFGIFQQAFFTDLSADPEDTLEYHLADKILGEMKPRSIVMGWHSYAKDTEGQHVTLTSSHALKMEGLNTLPNTSFNHQIPTTPGYSFRNNHNVAPDEVLMPEEKIYITPIQTDGIGIGAWLQPGRGEIPYAWEVTMNWSWLSPAIMEYFYEVATPNDYFIGVLSGPGYMYPKPIPAEQRRLLFAEAAALMDTLDLRVFEIMDYSEGNRQVGNLDLPRRIVDEYYEAMPGAIGFVNGYGAASTFDSREGVPFVSYDYYLDETRSIAEVVADLEELAALNRARPYFLTMHVRQRSSVAHVKQILDSLGPEFEVVPLDTFMRLAANRPTFVTRFLDSD